MAAHLSCAMSDGETDGQKTIPYPAGVLKCVHVMITGPVDSQDESLFAQAEVPLAVTLLLFC